MCEERTNISVSFLPTCLLENAVQGRTHPALYGRKGDEEAGLGLGNVTRIWFTRCQVCSVGTVPAVQDRSGTRYQSAAGVPHLPLAPRAGRATSNPAALATFLSRGSSAPLRHQGCLRSDSRASRLLLPLPLLFESTLWRSQVSTHRHSAGRNHVTLPLSG